MRRPAFSPAALKAAGRVAGATAAGVVLTACGSGDGTGEQPDDTAAGGAQSSEPVPPSAISHVHALEVDPADPERVYVATHEGLFGFEAGSGLQRVGDIRSDFMGFAVGPDGRLLGSGHPSPDEGGPFALGLISSTDAGRSWEPVALDGEADFHALDASDGVVIGYDAANGVLRVSDDGRTFTAVEDAPAFIDLATDPTRDRVLGTTGEAVLVASDDGGRTFAAVAGAPPLVLVDVAEDGTIIGIGVDGAVHAASDGKSWQQREGAADQGLQAFTAGPNGAVWLLDSRGLVRSSDLGDSFSAVEGW